MTAKLVEIGEFVEAVSGPAFESARFTDDPSDVPLIKGENIAQGHIAWEKSRYWPTEEAEEYERFGLVAGDIVLAMDRPWVTAGLKWARMKPHDPSCLLVQRVARLRAKPGLRQDFLAYVIGSAAFSKYVRNVMGGTNVPHISGAQIKAFKFQLPGENEQAAIASTLSAYDDLIENNRRRIALLEESARLLYREWFVDFRFPGREHVQITDGLPEGWDRRTLGDVVEVVKKSVKPSDFEEHDIHIGLEHIPRRSFTLADWEPAEGLASAKWRFEEGDILFCKIRPYFHKVGFAMRKGLASSDALVWRVHREADWPIVLCATSSDHFVAVASKTMREGSKMPRADWNVLRDYVIPKPPKGLIDVFNDTVRAIAAQCKTLALQNRVLAEGRDILLPRLMNGEIAV